MYDYGFHDLIKPLSDGHQEELQWFEKNKGQTIPWKYIKNRKLARSPKGIYCPAGKDYALAIKNIIGSEYSLRESHVFEHDNGAFYFEYPTETAKRGKDIEFYTNAKLCACGKDFVPIGLIYQITQKPSIYHVYGPALVRYHEDTNIFQVYGFNDLFTVRFL